MAATVGRHIITMCLPVTVPSGSYISHNSYSMCILAFTPSWPFLLGSLKMHIYDTTVFKELKKVKHSVGDENAVPFLVTTGTAFSKLKLKLFSFMFQAVI